MVSPVDPTSAVLSKIGRPLNDLLDFDEKWQEFKEEYKKGEKGIVEQLTQKIKAGDTSEPDLLSAVLSEKIQELKDGKESVLVLDDLDRIDPEHIFRILNVFSAHLHDFSDGEERNKNKFGFDRVVLVGDYENLRKIFHHKYGPDTDYRGYMDKFYSSEPYNLNIHNLISERVVEEIVSNFKCSNELKASLGVGGIFAYLPLIVVTAAFELGGLISLREVLNPQQVEFVTFYNKPIQHSYFLDQVPRTYTDLSIQFLIRMLGGKERLLTILSRLARLESSEKVSRYGVSVAGLLLQRTQNYTTSDIILPIGNGKSVYYQAQTEPVVYNSSVDHKLMKSNFFQILHDYIEKDLYIDDMRAQT